MRKIYLIFLFIISAGAKAQENYSLKNDLSIDLSGEILSAPFAGGINSAQIQTIDLTGDGKEEWAIWDINSRQLQVFEKSGDGFTHLPELSYLFPTDISGFLKLVDFDGDGKKDLFTATALGIKAYKNTSQGNQLSWSLAQNFLKLDGSGNIQVNNLDTPLIQDLDGDGDLDLVIFNFASGDFLEFYKNTSIERKGIADLDGFEFPVRFWGNFVFCGCSEFTFGQTCQGSPIAPNSRIDENQRIQHAGGHSILYKDFDGDGVNDLVLGRDECSSLYFLPNGGTNANPIFESFKTEIPGYGKFPEFPLFHIGQLIEDELIISLNTNESAFNYAIDFQNSIVKLSSNGNLTSPYLQDQILDLGENSRPFFKGNKNSGTLIFTSNQFKNGEIKSKVSTFAFRNNSFISQEIGADMLGNLQILDAQYLEFKDKTNQSYQFYNGVIFENNIPKQQLYEVFSDGVKPLSISGYEPKIGDYLQFFGYSQNDYLLVAKQNGGLDLYEMNFNSLTATVQEIDFLDFSDNPANRNLNVAVLQKDKPDLYAIDQRGILVKVKDFMNSDLREEVLVTVGIQNFPTRLGRNTWIAVVNPLFSEAPDLILGTKAGGMIYFKSTDNQNSGSDEFQLKVYPNPSSGPIKIITNLAAKGRLVNAMGQILLEDIDIPANTTVEIQSQFLTPGLYILNLEVDGRFTESRKIWIR
ncbi:MAG: FG-GAP-like repeat-containing protein [Algoriphagus sp.]|uniref:FG-GAP-like repeat-containing protein n=1 Tax=Algoriphagus sp. TaxID=1872435 RepID=UPI002635145F|nr:FG-GAP-like repeat-containing protein [Algoriphagus sp.]MDG1279452.1 FG-GAP-like repeat-containing protein [Algoriphagus sp.]